MRGPARAGRHDAIAYQLSVEFDGVLPRATVEAEVEALDVHIRRLRRKIERDPDDPECVVAVRGRGYKAGNVG